MATILLSAAGAAAGSAIGGSVFGLSMSAVGRFAGATLGRRLDQQILGLGSDPVATGKTDSIRMTNAGEGAAVPRVWGRTKLGGQVIWASKFQENVTTEGGGKGRPATPQVQRYSYSVSLAIALCEGPINGITRVWADGVEISMTDIDIRVYSGTEDQLPDPKMEAVEGAGEVPAYRGLAYVVIEDLSLERFGNRVPQFGFEVVRASSDGEDPSQAIQAVAMMPGSGEYALATSPVYFDLGAGETRVANVNAPSGISDLDTSLDALETELPNCSAVSLIVSWFGDDLRCGDCTLTPRVEQNDQDASMPWFVSGLDRTAAETVPTVDNRPVYGGTPSDASVVEAIKAMADRGQAVMFYPFILMTQMDGNTLIDPWSGGGEQPNLPWRGRITTSLAPHFGGSPDGTSAADSEVEAFFGTAQPSDFVISDGSVSYNGPSEWGYRRFILHYAALCVAAGGVDSFCIGSEMRALTQIRGANGFPAVDALIELAADVRGILGAETKIGYAADWSEYFGYHPQDGSGDVFFHLDPLWASSEIDFIGVDNYMPLSDWRDGKSHADSSWGRIDDVDYLESNIEGGEGFDWFYASQSDRDAQLRTPITDGAHGEPWVFRYKDLRSWWQSPHHNRVGGLRDETATDWVPESKPIWFTELGCAAIDKGTNAPNLFQDPKSSESALPPFSNGRRDESIQRAYLIAMHRYWQREAPTSSVYGGSMLDMSRAFVWAWDARPYPWFPNAGDVWSDGENYARGHWITGRMSSQSFASVTKELCNAVGVDPDVSEMSGIVRGFVVDEVDTVRAALQPLMLAFGADATEVDGKLRFLSRGSQDALEVGVEELAVHADLDGPTEIQRASEADVPRRVRMAFVEAGGTYDVAVEEASIPNPGATGVSGMESALVLTRSEGRQMAERWLHEARVGRNTYRFAMPLSFVGVSPGDVILLDDTTTSHRLRIDRVELGSSLLVEAVQVDDETYTPSNTVDDVVRMPAATPAAPVFSLVMDLPLVSGDEEPHAPHIAVAARPWRGTVAVYSSASDAGYSLDKLIDAQSVIGVTQNELVAGPVGRIDRGAALTVKLTSGTLSSIDDAGLRAGENLFAIGDGSPGGWELFQAQRAELVGERTWNLSHRLRGQSGTDADMPDVWPAGSYVVAINGTPQQLPLSSGNRAVARHYRIGPAAQSYDHSSYVHTELSLDGLGLRPYRIAHLKASEDGQGGLSVSWLRRTRIDGDAWDGFDVPLGEESESYRLQVRQGENVLREETLSSHSWTYDAAVRAVDGGGVSVAVAQISARFGIGPFVDIALPG